MQKWEYLYVHRILLSKYEVNGAERPDFKSKPPYVVLNTLGEEGWEFVHEDRHQNTWIFKRPKSSPTQC